MLGGEMMTLGERIKKEGWDEGMEKGVVKTAQRMLQMGMEKDVILKVTQLSSQELGTLECE